jgi:hypothetical protein
VRRLALAVESPDTVHVDLDDLRLLGGRRGRASAHREAAWYLATAFAGARVTSVHEDGFLIGTDAEAVTEADLRRLLGRMRPLSRWMRRVFGDAVRPTAEGPPVPLLIFRDRKGYRAFFERLGTTWQARISPPSAGGYTIQDIATSYHDAMKGVERPVYFHETVHAVGGRLLRLVPGSRNHSWLQEGMANYLQLCLYPGSIDRAHLVRHFSRPVDPEGRTFFKPLRSLIGGRIDGSRYLQLAVLFAYLVSERVDLLRTLARGIADGETPERLLAASGTSFEALEKAWFAWGARTFAGGAAPPGGPGTHFPVPTEWVEREGGTADQPKGESSPEDE